jgi:hypothetical protein
MAAAHKAAQTRNVAFVPSACSIEEDQQMAIRALVGQRRDFMPRPRTRSGVDLGDQEPEDRAEAEKAKAAAVYRPVRPGTGSVHCVATTSRSSCRPKIVLVKSLEQP